MIQSSADRVGKREREREMEQLVEIWRDKMKQKIQTKLNGKRNRSMKWSSFLLLLFLLAVVRALRWCWCVSVLWFAFIACAVCVYVLYMYRHFQSMTAKYDSTVWVLVVWLCVLWVCVIRLWAKPFHSIYQLIGSNSKFPLTFYSYFTKLAK